LLTGVTANMPNVVSDGFESDAFH